MAVKLQVRRGTAVEWTAANPILMVGELGVEQDGGQWKLGDGLLAWNSLAYAYGGIGPEHLTDYVRQPGYINPTAGTSTAYTGDTTPALSAYSEGVGITIVPHVDCGPSPTFAWGALAAVPLFKQDGTAYLAGDMVAGKPYMFRYVGTSFLPIM